MRSGVGGGSALPVIPVHGEGVFAWLREGEYGSEEWRCATRPVELKEGGTIDLGDLELRRRLPLRGRVVDHRGKPVAGLALIARPLGLLEESEKLRKATTGDDGRYEFPDLAVGDWNLLAGPEDDRLYADVVYPGDIINIRLHAPD